MEIKIHIPLKAEIVNGGFQVKVASEGESWEKGQLGDYADKRGVYVHHASGKILYVGKATEGPFGTFGERLRREFQARAAAAHRRLHDLLAQQNSSIYTYLLDLQDIDMMVGSGATYLSPERKALIMEQILIGIYEPEGNRQ